MFANKRMGRCVEEGVGSPRVNSVNFRVKKCSFQGKFHIIIGHDCGPQRKFSGKTFFVPCKMSSHTLMCMSL